MCCIRVWAALAAAQLISGPVVEAKVQQGILQIGGWRDNRSSIWRYVTRFTYGEGSTKYRIRLRPWRPRHVVYSTLVLEGYSDEVWPDAAKVEDDCQRKSFAKGVTRISINQTEWGAWHEFELTQDDGPHLWYFAVSDCNRSLANRTHKFRYEFSTTQPDGSQFSYEKQWMPPANLALLMASTVLFWSFGRAAVAFGRASGSVHPVIWTLLAAILLQYIAQSFATMHLYSYSSNGQGLKPLEVLSDILFVASSMVQTSLLILIALGYTLLQSKLGELDIAIFPLVMVGAINILIIVLTKVNEDHFDDFHEHEGPLGWGLVILRTLMWIWFMWAACSTTRAGGLRLQNFMLQFKIAGTLYFLAYPTLIFVLPMFPRHMRYQALSTGATFMQVVSNAYLATLFLRRSGKYFEVSTLNWSDLPDRRSSSNFDLLKDDDKDE